MGNNGKKWGWEFNTSRVVRRRRKLSSIKIWGSSNRVRISTIAVPILTTIHRFIQLIWPRCIPWNKYSTGLYYICLFLASMNSSSSPYSSSHNCGREKSTHMTYHLTHRMYCYSHRYGFAHQTAYTYCIVEIRRMVQICVGVYSHR